MSRLKDIEKMFAEMGLKSNEDRERFFTLNNYSVIEKEEESLFYKSQGVTEENYKSQGVTEENKKEVKKYNEGRDKPCPLRPYSPPYEAFFCNFSMYRICCVNVRSFSLASVCMYFNNSLSFSQNLRFKW